MSTFDYPDVKIGARVDAGNGLLVVSALVDGVEVPLATHKLGHFSDQLDAAAQARAASAASTPGESTST